jgi:hypothetical protein
VSHLDVRRLAALDMWGTAGTARRRRIIRAEFFLGVLGCTGLGSYVLLTGSGGMLAVGAWLVGAGINYVPLAWQAQLLSTPGALEDELAGVDIRRALRQAGVRQLWIAVPLAVAYFALADGAHRPDG